MNDKDLNELFDIEAAKSVFMDVLMNESLHLASDKVVNIIKAATKGREYVLKPEARDWVQGEEMPEVPFWCDYGDSKSLVERIFKSECLVVCQDGSFGVVEIEDLKPIPPKPKKIDHSSLVGSGIDCVYKTDAMEYTDEYCSNLWFQSIRLNHPMVLTEKQIKAIPEGYSYRLIDSSVTGVIVIVDGIKDNWEL